MSQTKRTAEEKTNNTQARAKLQRKGTTQLGGEIGGMVTGDSAESVMLKTSMLHPPQRSAMVQRLAQTHGNAHVGRLVAQRNAHTLQRQDEAPAQDSTSQKDDPKPFSDEDVKNFKQAYVVKAENCMVAVYDGLGALYGKDYSEKLLKRVYKAAEKERRRTKKNSNNINRLLDTVAADGKADAKTKLTYKNGEKWSPEPESTLLSKTGSTPGWYFFGFSLHDGYHSIILAVDKSDPADVKIHWADQINAGIQDVTGQLKEKMLELEPPYGYHHCYLWRLIPAADTKVPVEQD